MKTMSHLLTIIMFFCIMFLLKLPKRIRSFKFKAIKLKKNKNVLVSLLK